MRLSELLPLTVQLYRRLSKEEGPRDRLQTREFRKVVSEIPEESFFSYLLYYMPLRYQEGLSLIGECPEPPKKGPRPLFSNRPLRSFGP